MSVAFTGISNIKILKKKPVLEYYMNTEKAEQSIRRSEETKLKFTLTNDESGNDIDKFNETVKKGLALSGEKISKTTVPADISILIKHYTFPHEEFKPAESQFMVNQTLVPLNKPSDLAMFTYMAKLTRDIAKKPEMSSLQKDSLAEINSFVADEAVKFIEK